MRNLWLFSITVFCWFANACTLTTAQKPIMTPQIRSIMKYDEAHKHDVETMIHDLVSIDSPTQNKLGVHQALMWVKNELHQLNFETTWDETYGHLTAIHKGVSSPILLVAHADTVKTLNENPFRSDGADIIHGAGVSDDKGGIVVAIQAMRALQNANLLKDMSIRFYIGADEEFAAKPLSKSRQTLRELAQGCTYGIGLENGNNKEEQIITERRGIVGWNLSLTAMDGHSSLVGRDLNKDGRGMGAIYSTSALLGTFYTWMIGTEQKTLASVNVAVLVSGTTSALSLSQDATSVATGKLNSIPSSAHANGELRSMEIDQDEVLMQGLIDQTRTWPGVLTAKIHFDEAYPPMHSRETTLFDTFRIACENIDGSVITKANPRSIGASDMAFVSDLVSSVIDGVGTKGGSADHSVNETASIRGMRKASVRLAVLLSRLK